MKHCLIIGAGMSGLAAANLLLKNNWKVTVLDKGRGVGGRMSTRRLTDGKADHGAQYFSAKTNDFQAFTQELLAKNIIDEWHVEGKAFKRFVGKNGMSVIPKYMSESLDVRTSERAIGIKKNGTKYEVLSESGNSFTADVLLVTSPAPQTVDLLKNSELAVGSSVFEALESIVYLPCIAVMALVNTAPELPASGNITFENGEIAWIADNAKKGISVPQTVTIHASAEYSKLRFEDDLNAVRDELLTLASPYISAEKIIEKQIHRWRYSLADKRYAEPFLSVNDTLLLGGDGFGIGNVEGAFLSGIAMANSLI